MNLFQQFINRFNHMIADEDKRHADERFLRAVESIERTLKRSLTGAEYRVTFSLDDPQAELMTKLLKEANKG